MKVHVTSHGLARSGKPESEDAFACKAWDDRVIAVLADGVGSARDAREASSRIVHSLIHHFAARPRSWSPDRALGEFIQQINRSLYEESIARHSTPELAATVAAVVIENGQLYGLNVGDSRIYLFRNGTLNQLSQDHVLNGVPHALSRAVGLAPTVEPHIFTSPIADSDFVLLCSDGVSNHFDADSLNLLLQRKVGARTIVRKAVENSTPESADDASAIVLEIEDARPMVNQESAALEIPPKLRKGDEMDGFTLQRSFQNDDRVWLAVKDEQRFILKFAPREAADSEEHFRLFECEKFHATRLRSASFPRAFLPEYSRWNYYAMNFIEAPALSSVLKRRTLTTEEGIALGCFLCRAAQELTALGLLHGDIKPDNVLISREDDTLSFKLLDLGTALDIFTIHARAGTASYLAPERFGDAPATERTEVFAIGVTLYQALTQRLPYGEIERFQTPHFRSAKHPMQLNPLLPPWLDAVLMRAIAPAAEVRYHSFSELLFDLEHPESVQPFHTMKSREQRAFAFYRAAFFILLAAVIFYVLTRIL